MAPLEPAVVIEVQPDSTIRITYGDVSGTVSSFHLIEPKARQLRAIWQTLHPPEDEDPHQTLSIS